MREIVLELIGRLKRFNVVYHYGGAPVSDEPKIVLEDVKEKSGTVIEAFNVVKERLDRHEQAEEERFQGVEERLDRHEGRLQRIEDRLRVLQKDFSDHRENTELHAVKKGKKAS